MRLVLFRRPGFYQLAVIFLIFRFSGRYLPLKMSFLCKKEQNKTKQKKHDLVFKEICQETLTSFAKVKIDLKLKAENLKILV